MNLSYPCDVYLHATDEHRVVHLLHSLAWQSSFSISPFNHCYKNYQQSNMRTHKCSIFHKITPNLTSQTLKLKKRQASLKPGWKTRHGKYLVIHFSVTRTSIGIKKASFYFRAFNST